MDLRALHLSHQRLIALAIGVLTIYASLMWWHIAGPGVGAGSDFGAYFTGAQSVAQGENPYHRLFIATQQGQGAAIQANGYVYPPLLATLLALPLKLGLGQTELWIIWNLLSLVACVVMATEIFRYFAPTGAGRVQIIGLTALLIVPAVVLYDLWLGQADIIVTALGVLACGLWLRRSPWAALALGAAIAIKPTMAVIALLWLWKRDWRFVGMTVLASIALIIGPFAFLGLNTAGDYLGFLTHWKGLQADAAFINQSIYGMLLRLFTQNNATQPLIEATWLVQPLRFISLGALLVVWARAVTPQMTSNHRRAFAECLLTLPLVIFLSPLAEEIHVCVIVPTLVGFAYLAVSQRLPGKWAHMAALALASIPRMQEIIYPDRFVIIPGQDMPLVGSLIILVRSGALLWITLLSFFAGVHTLRALAPIQENVKATSETTEV